MKMRDLGVLLVACLISTACASATFAPPEGCRLGSEDAASLAQAFLEENGVNWGDPVDISFDGDSFRLVYETPQGSDQRSLIVDCNTGTITQS